MARAPGGAAWLGAFARHWRDRHWPRRAAASHRNPSRLVAARETGRRRPAGLARRRRLAWPAARRGGRTGWRSVLAGSPAAPLRSGLEIFAGYSPFRTSPRRYAGLLRPEPSPCAGRATSAGTVGAGWRQVRFIPPAGHPIGLALRKKPRRAGLFYHR